VLLKSPYYIHILLHTARGAVPRRFATVRSHARLTKFKVINNVICDRSGCIVGHTPLRCVHTTFLKSWSPTKVGLGIRVRGVARPGVRQWWRHLWRHIEYLIILGPKRTGPNRTGSVRPGKGLIIVISLIPSLGTSQYVPLKSDLCQVVICIPNYCVVTWAPKYPNPNRHPIRFTRFSRADGSRDQPTHRHT